MSVQTEADEKRDSAKKHIAAALKDLNTIIVDQCWGWDEYNADYFQTLVESHATLLELRDKL